MSGGNFYRPITGRLSKPIYGLTIGVDLPVPADAGFLSFLKMNLLPKQSTRSPLLRSQVGASLMTFPLVKL